MNESVIDYSKAVTDNILSSLNNYLLITAIDATDLIERYKKSYWSLGRPRS